LESEGHAERHRRRRRPDGLSEMEGVTLTLVIPKKLDLHEVGMIGIDQDYGSARRKYLCYFRGNTFTVPSWRCGSIGVTIGPRQDMTIGELRCYAEERSKAESATLAQSLSVYRPPRFNWRRNELYHFDHSFLYSTIFGIAVLYGNVFCTTRTFIQGSLQARTATDRGAR
jgi:hypothetical protein